MTLQGRNEPPKDCMYFQTPPVPGPFAGSGGRVAAPESEGRHARRGRPKLVEKRQGSIHYSLEDDPMDPRNHWLVEENKKTLGPRGPDSQGRAVS